MKKRRLLKIKTINETNRIKEKAIQTLGFLAVCYRKQSEHIIILKIF